MNELRELELLYEEIKQYEAYKYLFYFKKRRLRRQLERKLNEFMEDVFAASHIMEGLYSQYDTILDLKATHRYDAIIINLFPDYNIKYFAKDDIIFVETIGLFYSVSKHNEESINRMYYYGASWQNDVSQVIRKIYKADLLKIIEYISIGGTYETVLTRYRKRIHQAYNIKKEKIRSKKLVASKEDIKEDG